MAVSKVEALSRSLLAAGLTSTTRVEVVAHASQPQELRLTVPLASLAGVIRDHGAESPAVLILRRPKSAVARPLLSVGTA